MLLVVWRKFLFDELFWYVVRKKIINNCLHVSKSGNRENTKANHHRPRSL